MLKTISMLLILSKLLCAYEIGDFILSKSIKNKTPVDIQTEFNTNDQKVYAFVKLKNTNGEKFSFEWYKEEELYYKMPFQTQASTAWRVYSCVKSLPGQWQVKIKNENGEEIAIKEFNVTKTTKKEDIRVNTTQKDEDKKERQPKTKKNKTKGLVETLESLNPKVGS